MPSVVAGNLLWINKTAKSASLSHSEDSERLKVFSQAQRTSRLHRGQKPSRRRHVPSQGQKRGVQYSRKTAKPAVEQDIGPFDDIFDAYTFDESSVYALSRKEKQSRDRKGPRHQIKRVPILDPTWTAEERRGVNYFLDVTVFKIITLNRDAVFWIEIVPCLTELHPAFRHLVVAIASTHELLFKKDADSLNIFALEQCNKATQSLLSSRDLGPSWLLVSCILVSAYNLLRCDLVSADKSIESGLKMATRPDDASSDGFYAPGTGWHGEYLKLILIRLGKQHGFKLWAPDIIFQFDKSDIATESLEVETNCVKGPFVDVGQILLSYKTMLVELVAKVMRNLARGAYVPPHCLLAQEASQQLAEFYFYWELYNTQLTPEDRDKRMELTQLRMGFYSVYVLFHTKVVSSNELAFDAHTQRFQKMLELADEILTARHAGLPVIYVDRIVNGALFTLGLCCRDPVLRRRAVALLQSQVNYEDGLVNWLRGMIVDMVIGVEERRLNVQCCGDIPVHRRIHLAGMHCREDDKAVRLQYTKAAADSRLNAMEDWLDWDPSFGATLSAREIDDCLKGIMATYTMYGKADVSQAPRGYVRRMYHRGRPVPVHWEEGRNSQRRA